MAVGLPEGPSYPRHSPFIFSLCCPLNDRRRAAHSIFEIGRMFLLLLLSCPALALLRLLILLLLLMGGGVHPGPGPIFPCSVCAGNVAWRGRSVRCCACSGWVHLGCSQLSLSNFGALGGSRSWSCPPCRGAVAPPSSDSSGTCASTVRSGPPSAGAALLPRPRLRASCPPSAHLVSPSPALPPPSLAPGYTSAPPASSPPPDSLRVLQWGAGGLRAGGTELLHFLSSHPVDLVCIQESNLNSSSSFRIPGFSVLRSGRAHSRSGVLSSGASRAGGGVVIFVGRGLSFSGLSAASLSSLGPCSDCVGVGISLGGSSSVSFLGVCAPPVRSSPADGGADSFSPSVLPSSGGLFILGDFDCRRPLWGSGGASGPRGGGCSAGSSPRTSSPSSLLAPALLRRSSGGRSSPDVSFAPSALAFSCSWGVLRGLGSDHLPVLLSVPLSPVFRPGGRPPSFGFRRARWDDFASCFDSRCPAAEECSSLSLSSAAALFASLAVDAAGSSVPFGRIGRPPGAWWSAGVGGRLVEDVGLLLLLAGVVGVAGLASPPLGVPRRSLPGLGRGRRPALLFHLGLILDLCALFFALLLALLPRLLPLLTFLAVPLPGGRLRSVPLAWGLAFLCLGRGPCAPEPGAASLGSAEPRALWSLARPFALPSLPLDFLRLPPASPRPLPLARTALPVPCWGVFLALAWIFFFASSVFLGLRIPFLPSGGHLLMFPCTGWGGLSALLLPSGLSLSPPACRSFLGASCCPVFSFFWGLVPFFLPAGPVSALDGLHLIGFCAFLSPFRVGLAGPGRALGQSCLLSISLELLALSGAPPFSTGLFRLASLLALLVGLSLSFLTGALVWFFEVTGAVPFGSVGVFRGDPFLALCFSPSSSVIFRLLCLLPSAALFALAVWPFGPPPPRSPLRWRPHKELCFDWSAGLSTGVFLSIRANVGPPSFQWIPTRLTSGPASSCSAPASVLIPLQLFLGSPSTALFPFLGMCLR